MNKKHSGIISIYATLLLLICDLILFRVLHKIYHHKELVLFYKKHLDLFSLEQSLLHILLHAQPNLTNMQVYGEELSKTFDSAEQNADSFVYLCTLTAHSLTTKNKFYIYYTTRQKCLYAHH